MEKMSVKPKYEFHNYWNQFYAVFSGKIFNRSHSVCRVFGKHFFYLFFAANFIMFSHGCILGWVAPALMLLRSDETPLTSGPITLEQLSWIGSMHCIGAMFGTFTFGFFTSFMGCKRVMAFLGIPAVCYWLTIIYGDSVNFIIFARFLAGWTGGGIFSITVLYVADIADNK